IDVKNQLSQFDLEFAQTLALALRASVFRVEETDQIQMSNFKIHFILKPTHSLPSTWMSAFEWDRVLINLFVNALHAMGNSDDKTLTIETDLDGNQNVLRVTDTGHGIPSGDINQIW